MRDEIYRSKGRPQRRTHAHLQQIEVALEEPHGQRAVPARGLRATRRSIRGEPASAAAARPVGEGAVGVVPKSDQPPRHRIAGRVILRVVLQFQTRVSSSTREEANRWEGSCARNLGVIEVMDAASPSPAAVCLAQVCLACAAAAAVGAVPAAARRAPRAPGLAVLRKSGCGRQRTPFPACSSCHLAYNLSPPAPSPPVPIPVPRRRQCSP
jgi:hypothetical protein